MSLEQAPDYLTDPRRNPPLTPEQICEALDLTLTKFNQSPGVISFSSGQETKQALKTALNSLRLAAGQPALSKTEPNGSFGIELSYLGSADLSQDALGSLIRGYAVLLSHSSQRVSPETGEKLRTTLSSTLNSIDAKTSQFLPGEQLDINRFLNLLNRESDQPQE
ncbi:MAG: hypothetical protein ACK5HO_15530 [Pseudomonadota bacterium]|jgi:hypothetical protein